MSRSEVDDFLAALQHPRTSELEALRALILGLHREVTEGIKWNAPSFKLDDDFATFHLRGKAISLILHSGARSKLKLKPLIEDPSGLLEWRGADRAVVTFAEAPSAARLRALRGVLRSWLAALR